LKRLELVAALLVLAGIALAIVLARPAPPDESLFGAEPGLPPTLAPLALPQGSLTLAGRVTTAAGAPAEDAFVVLLAPDDGTELAPLYPTYTDSEGCFALQDLPAGTLRVVLSHPSAPPRTFALELPVAGEVAWTLAEPLPPLPALPPLERVELSGRLRAAEGIAAADLAGFEVWLVPEPSTPLLAGACERRTTTAADGSFSFPELVAADYRASCLPPWARGGTWPILARERVGARAGEPDPVGLVLEVGAVEGTVVEASGRPLAGAVVSVASLDAPDPVGHPALWPPVAADPAGSFRLELLPPGRYLVHVRAGSARGDVEVLVERGRTTTVPLGPLEPRAGADAPRQ
jgi:hypothetical protein